MGTGLKRIQGKNGGKQRSQGFTLIASLLMMLLLSGIAIGLMMMVNTEGKVGSTDLQNNLAYHAAEGGIQKMFADLTAVFQNAQAPAPSVICGVGTTSNEPAMVGVTWTQYSVMPGTTQSSTCPTSLTSSWGQVTAGTNKGLWAQVMPVNMLVTASMLGGQEVSMARTAQVALIPVFQFGAFSDSDLSLYNGSTLDFAGSVHTNGDFYPVPALNGAAVFHSNVSAYGNIVRTQLPNGSPSAVPYITASAYISTVSGSSGCASPPPRDSRGNLYPHGRSRHHVHTLWRRQRHRRGQRHRPNRVESITAASGILFPPAPPINWSTATMEARRLPEPARPSSKCPSSAEPLFPNELIRQPLATDTSPLTESREYNMAQIHVLLADDPADLPGGASDANNIRLANLSAAQVQAQTGATSTRTNQFGIPISSGNYNATAFGTPSGTNTYNLYFAAASNVIPWGSNCATSTSCTLDWPYAPIPWTANPNPSAGTDGLQPQNPSPGAANATNAPTFAMPSSAGLITGICPPTTAGVKSTVTQPTGCPATATYPYFAPPDRNGVNLYDSAYATSWSLIDGYLRVEYKDTSGNWNPVTLEWLQLGFARGLMPPTAPQTNPITKNAILLLQEPADARCLRHNEHHGKCPGVPHNLGKWGEPKMPDMGAPHRSDDGGAGGDHGPAILRRQFQHHQLGLWPYLRLPYLRPSRHGDAPEHHALQLVSHQFLRCPRR